MWYAENKIHKPAAVKFLLPKFCSDSDVVRRFKTEAEVTVKLSHPNIRQVYDYDEVDGRPCMVMEYLEGEDLSSRMKHGERFSDEQLRTWWDQLADALNYTHEQGVVHRDIKPSNIFVDARGNVKLLDFGIAKVRDSITSTATGAMMGTLMYMSPEQVRDSKHIDHKTDLYSLAVTFVHLLSGSAPYDMGSTDDYEIRKNIVETSLDLIGVPSVWQTFLRPYLAKRPEERPVLRAFGTGVSGIPPSETTVLNMGTCPESPFKGNSMDSESTQMALESIVLQDKTFTVDGVMFKMVAVEGGTFMMGGTDEQGDECCDDEKPAHRVKLSSFYIGETVVTQALWKAVMGNNPSRFKKWFGKSDDRPVEKVSWDDCQEFVGKLNKQLGGQLPAGWHFALPTEAQWEYAARGGTKSQGCKYAGSNNLDDVAWYRDNSGIETHPVKTKAANELGLYDMSGNVWEWCSDWYGDYSSDAQTNPKGASSGSYRVVRGGGWFSLAWCCRVSSRSNYNPSYRRDDLGLRLVLVP